MRFVAAAIAGFLAAGWTGVDPFALGPTAGVALAAAPQVPDATALLRSLEAADRDVRAITAQVQYDRHFKLQGDRHTRRGDLYFLVAERQGKRDRRVFAIDFATLIIDDRQQDDPQRWIFDGEWLVEARPAEKVFIKRRIALPDDNFDPLRIGEGPMPIPIGQKAEDILARYDAELRDPGELFGANAQDNAKLREFAKDTVHILLTPRGAFREQEDLQEIRLWYRWDDGLNRWLPRMARTLNRAGDQSYVQLINVKVARADETGDAMKIPKGIFDTSPPGDGWQVEVIDDLSKGDG